MRTIQWLALTLPGFLAACSGMVAPQTDSSANAFDQEQQTPTPTPTRSEYDPPASPTPGGPNPTATPTGGGAQPTATPVATAAPAGLGTITGEQTTFDKFAGASTYAMLSSFSAGTITMNMLTFTVTTAAVDEASLTKAVDHYTCTNCSGSSDPNCAKSSVATVAATFMSGTTQASNVSSGGFPLKNNNTIEQTSGPTDPKALDNMKIGLTFSESSETASTKQPFGTFNFTDDADRPKAAGDPYKADMKLTFGDGKTYDATISGKVLKAPAQPTSIPTCSANQYLKPTYK